MRYVCEEVRLAKWHFIRQICVCEEARYATQSFIINIFVYERVRFGKILCGSTVMRKVSHEWPNYLLWTYFSLDDFMAWPPYLTQINGSTKPIKAPHDEYLEIEPVTNWVLQSGFEIWSLGSYPLGPSKDFKLDIPGPKLALFRGPLVDLLMKFGASNYLEFKKCQGQLLFVKWHGLISVPDSPASIFQDMTLSLVEKRHLMRFIRLWRRRGVELVGSRDSVHRFPGSVMTSFIYKIVQIIAPLYSNLKLFYML